MKCITTHCAGFTSKGKRIFSFAVQMLLCLAFCFYGNKAIAQTSTFNETGSKGLCDWGVQYMTVPENNGWIWGVDQYGYYIQLYVRVADSRYPSPRVVYGTMSVQTSDGQTINIFDYRHGTPGDSGINDSKSSMDISVYPLQTGVELRAYNNDPVNNTWSDFVPAGKWITKTDGGAWQVEGEVRWYVPQSLMNKDFLIKFHIKYIDGNGYWDTTGYAANAGTGLDAQNNKGYFYYYSFHPYNNVNFSFPPSSTTPGMMTVHYAYNDTVADFGGYNYSLKHYMDNDTLDEISDNTNVDPSGSLDVNMSNQVQPHVLYMQATGKGGYLTYIQATQVSVPAYVWPSTFTATYDQRDSVKLEWQDNTANLGNGFVNGDDFDVQRSTDSTFATNVTEVTSTYTYNPSQSDYVLYDNLANIQGGTNVYYRIRRTETKDNWHWAEAKNTNVAITMNTTQQAGTVTLTNENGTPAAVITWQPFRGVWTNGITFSLKKTDKTTGTLVGTINLTEAQARSGQYIDQNITYCNEYNYAIDINLGNGYPSPSETPIPGSALAVNIGTLTNLTASKGYFPDRVELHWHTQGDFDNYIVERKVYGSSDNFIQIATVAGSSVSDLETDDSKGQPGVYYQYAIFGSVKCNGQTAYSRDTLYSIGFRAPTGNIYGRVTYANGQAVQDVAVRLQNEDNPQLGTSIHLNGQDSSYLFVDSLHTPFSDSALTVEAWIRPDDALPENQVIFSQPGQYELGFNAAGQLYFTYNGSTVTGNYFNKNNTYVHVAGIHSQDSLSLMINDSVIAAVAAPFSVPSNVSQAVYIGRNAAGNHYKGYVDEMRVWNVARTPQQIAQNYTRLLSGGEQRLVAYWRFDETINDQFYDLSYQSQTSTYNQNDGAMNPNDVAHSNLIPSSDQLALMDYTDSSGNYMIRGVPYTGNGTTYTIVPLFGTHQFSPTSSNRLISASSSSFDVDFTDNSSFPVTGYVYYFNSTIPVPGVYFLIDGKYAQASDGSLMQTDASGHFSISVPVGYHQVKAVMNNHVFEEGGRITDQFGNNLNYQAAVGPLTLYDSTTIRFIGRVAGGSVQAAYPLGHSLSTNNLGTQLSITMTLPSETKYDFINGNSDSTVTVDNFLPSDQDSSRIHKTRIVYYPHKIVIYPDSITGEFTANLVPVQFIAQAWATGWGNINSQVTLDFSNDFASQSSVYSYEDSTQTQDSSQAVGWNYTHYTDSVFYNAPYKFIERVTPEVSVVQLSPNGQPLPYFGDTTYAYSTLAGANVNIPLINPGAQGTAEYTLGYPVFTQNVSYPLEIKAFEQYPFYASVQADGTPVPEMKNGHAVVDNEPTSDGLVSVYDRISSDAAQADTMSLDSTGTAYYTITAGNPELQAPGTKSLSVSIKFGPATNANWSWNDNPDLVAYVAGGVLIGNDFVTAGPNKVLMVLRDPPGNNSYSSVQSGSAITSSSTYTGTVDQTGDETLVTKLGYDLITWTGIGAGVINKVEATNGITVGFHHEEHYTGTDTKTSTTTFTTGFQTSADPNPINVGSSADLYVGYSTDVTYGLRNNLAVIPSSDLQSTDIVLSGQSATSPYLVVERQGLNFGEKFGTLFAYPQDYIVNTLIPHLQNLRNTFLLQASSMTQAQAQEKANNEDAEVYVSKLAPADPNFGKSNDDTLAFGSLAKTDPFGNGESYTIYFPQSSSYRTDTIMILNEYVQKWKDQIALNEKEKLNATLLQNYSFHAGSPIDYSETTDYLHDKTNSFNFVISASIANSIDTKFNGDGAEFTYNESLGTQQGGSLENSQESTTTWGFQLASSGIAEYLSVDVDRAGDGGFVFKTKGGETACPYEPADSTLYYEKNGSKQPLNTATIPLEAPEIKVDNPVVNNVPSTQTASYTIHLMNNSPTSYYGNFLLYYANSDSVRGATIAVDGLSIANGRSYSIVNGSPITVVLTLAKGPNAMDYNNIPIILQSACEWQVADTILISAHFVPSCSNVNVESPDNNWVVNTQSPGYQQGNPYLPVTLNGFDESNNLFDHIELQYKPSQNSQWIPVIDFYGDSAKYNAAQSPKAFITNAQAINYNLVMNDATFEDENYDIRALAVCDLGDGNYIHTPSNVVSGVKDTYNPRPFGVPQPGNGILGIGQNILLNFNEPVAAGLLTPDDFQVTGIRNGAQGDSSVSVRLDGQSDYIQSEFNKNLAGKDITAEMWVLPGAQENGTVFSQGDSTESMELAFTADNHLQVTVGNQVIESDNPLNVQPNQWAHVALEYDTSANLVSAFYNFIPVIHNAQVNSYTGTGPFVFGRSIKTQGNYFAGQMRDARIWTQDQSATTLQTKSNILLSGDEEGLLAYFPMNEGKGNIIFDKAHGDNASLTGTWNTPPGKAVSFNGNNAYLQVNTSTIPVTSGMDYTISLWFKAQPGQTNAALASSGKGDGTDPGSQASENLFCLGFENGLLTFENNGFKVQAAGNYLDNQWHQVVITVNRNAGTGMLYVDDTLKNDFNTQNLGGIASPYIYLGARGFYNDTNEVTPQIDRYLNGEIDEFRIWDTYLSQKLIAQNGNVRLNGDEIGLMAYYPFENYVSHQNQQFMSFTLADQVSDTSIQVPPAIAVNAMASDDMAPIKDRGPVSNLNFNYVVNNDALIINLLESPQAIDKTTVTMKVQKVQDLQGNTMVSPVTWTAYIDQNSLKWSDDGFNLTIYQHQSQQFQTYIMNRGGQTEQFQLDNIPAWLTATQTSGSVDPEGKQQITFTVNDGLNIGTYNEIVYMRNDNGETEALPINITVKGKAPAWQVNPADFDYNMTIYGKIRINGVFSADSSDILAAFMNGQCVGVTHSVYFSKQGLWYAFLTVYSNSAVQARTDKLEFRIWDAGTGTTYEGIPSQSITFNSDAIVGTPDAPVIFDAMQLLFQNIDLTQGWNWISFDLLNNNLSNVTTTLENGTWASGDIVKNNSRFDQYSTTKGWGGNLSFNNTSLFKLQTANAQTLSIEGTLPDLSTIPIPVQGNGWNYISYLPQVNMMVADALADYNASAGDEIKSQTGFSMYSATKGWVGNLTYLEPGKGYMLYRAGKTNTQFTYPALSGTLNTHRLAVNGNSTERLNPNQLPVQSNFYFEDNMTMVAIVGKEFTLQPDDKILAHVGNDLRGKAQAINDPVINTPSFFFNISGDMQEPVYFTVERNGKVIARTKPVVSYLPNSLIGTLKEPFVLDFEKVSAENANTEVTIYPNPFNKKVSIYVNLKGQRLAAHTIQISISNVNGQLVFIGTQERITGGYYYKTWNGKTGSGADCAPGIYFIRIMIDNTPYVYKVMKY